MARGRPPTKRLSIPTPMARPDIMPAQPFSSPIPKAKSISVTGKVAAVALRAAFMPGGTAMDEDSNIASGIGKGLVELAIHEKDNSHSRYIIRVPEKIEMEIVEVL